MPSEKTNAEARHIHWRTSMQDLQEETAKHSFFKCKPFEQETIETFRFYTSRQSHQLLERS